MVAIVTSAVRGRRRLSCVKPYDLQLVGLAEAAKTIGTTSRQFLSWSRRDDFPEPVARLKTPCWHRADIVRWSREHEAAVK